MNKLFKTMSFLAGVALVMTSCSAQVGRAQPGGSFHYMDFLGESLKSKDVVEFLSANRCTSVAQYKVCKEAGMAFWMDTNQVFTKVFLYLNNNDGFAAYKGELPFGLKFYDMLGAVEYKLQRQGVGEDGLPDRGDTPDHRRYWATYRQAGITIIYNCPYADEDATIYAILVHG